MKSFNVFSTQPNVGTSSMLRTFAPRAALLTVGLLLATSCVSQRQYDDLTVSTKRAQQTLFEREQYVQKLEVENERLKRALAQNDVANASDAGFGGDDIGTRLSELQARIDGLGRPVQDIERFDVDGGYVLMVQDKILFDSGSAELSADGKKALDKVAAEIAQKPHSRIYVRGHTDADKVSKPATKERFPHGNLQLSAARAVEVAAELVNDGKVDSKDVVVMGFGPNDPVKKNDSAENKRLNRRVEIFVSDNKGAAARPASSAKPAKTEKPNQ